MTILSATDDAYQFTTQAFLVNDDRDQASAWASNHIYHNPNLRWIVGNYVEADNANSNGQYWSLDDLRIKSMTVTNGPMNIGHVHNDIVGTYVAAELLYPTAPEAHAYVETVAAFWKYYFPEENAIVEAAYRDGTLFQSMECIADSITCVGSEAACGQTFDYAGPYGQYCEHIMSGTAARQMNNPQFLGGGLIIPPVSPGWKGASINDLSKVINDAEAEPIYNQVAEEASHLEPSQWEAIMQEIIINGKATQTSNLEQAEAAGRLRGIIASHSL